MLPPKLVRAVFLLDQEVMNGGHKQYFFNTMGNDWRDAITGLKAMECRERTAIFQEAIAKFGDGGPSIDRGVRWEQLDEIEVRGDRFDELDSRYYDCPEVLEVFIARYVIRNADSF